MHVIADPSPARPHAGHLRKGRVSEQGRAYLVTAVTAGRAPLFVDWKLGRVVVREMRLACDAGLACSLAWVVMPDHLHWLLTLGEVPLAALMREVKGRSGYRVNAALRRHGRVWQPGYHDHALRREEDLEATARYIVANPLRAGLCRRLGDYPLWDAVWA